MRVTRIALFLVVASLSPIHLAQAADPAESRITLHIQSGDPNPPTLCHDWSAEPVPCSQYVSRLSIPYWYQTVYVVAVSPDPGLRGVSFGIDYDWRPGRGVDALTWTSCGAREVTVAGNHGDWPAARSGLRLSWDECRNQHVAGFESEGVHALVGALWIYAYGNDMISIFEPEDPRGPTLSTTNCLGEVTPVPPENAACAFIGWPEIPEGPLPSGVNPCAPAELDSLYSPRAALFVGFDSDPARCGWTSGMSGFPLRTTGTALDPDHGAPYWVYLVATTHQIRPHSNISGMEAGIDYPPHESPGQGMEVLEWHPCVEVIPTPDWPDPGSGISAALTWERHHCDHQPFSVMGYFLVAAYGDSRMRIIPHPSTDRVAVAYCTRSGPACDTFRPVQFDRAFLLPPEHCGNVFFGPTGNGCNPAYGDCLTTSQQTTTWGSLKTRYHGHPK